MQREPKHVSQRAGIDKTQTGLEVVDMDPEMLEVEHILNYPSAPLRDTRCTYVAT